MPRPRRRLHPILITAAVAAATTLTGCGPGGPALPAAPGTVQTHHALVAPERCAGRWAWRGGPIHQSGPIVIEIEALGDNGLLVTFVESDPPVVPFNATVIRAQERSYAVLRRAGSFLEDLRHLPMVPDTTMCLVLPLVIDDDRLTPAVPPVALMYPDFHADVAGTFVFERERVETAPPGDLVIVGGVDDAIAYYESRDESWFSADGSFVRVR